MTFTIKRLYNITCLLLTLHLITACQTSLQTPSPSTLMKQKTNEKKSSTHLTHWSLQGLMGVRQNKKAWSAQISWNQTTQTKYDLHFYGPMGGGSTMITRNGNQVVLRDGSKTVQAKDAQTLLHKQTGMNVPVELLYYWVRGIPAPGSVNSTKFNHDNTYSQFTQAGYTISYIEYQFVDGYSLPTKMLLQGPNLTLKFIVKSWNVS